MHDKLLSRSLFKDREFKALPLTPVADFRDALQLLVENSSDSDLTIDFRFEINIQTAAEVTE